MSGDIEVDEKVAEWLLWDKVSQQLERLQYLHM